MTKTNTFIEHPQRATLVTCDIWDTDYISGNWGLDFLKIFVTWQSRVTLDSIRNSCDVLYNILILPLDWKHFMIFSPDLDLDQANFQTVG